MILEPPEPPLAEYRNVDTAPRPRRGDPLAPGRGRGPHDGAPHPGRSVIAPTAPPLAGPSFTQSYECCPSISITDVMLG